MSNKIPLHVIAVTGIIQKGSRYLLARRSLTDDQAPGDWSIPGGKVEKENGEYRIEDTLKKEIMEEVGIKIKDTVELIYNDSFVRSSGDQVMMLTFVCQWKSGVAKPLEDQEEIKWLTLKEIIAMKDLPDYTRKRFEALKNYK